MKSNGIIKPTKVLYTRKSSSSGEDDRELFHYIETCRIAGVPMARIARDLGISRAKGIKCSKTL